MGDMFRHLKVNILSLLISGATATGIGFALATRRVPVNMPLEAARVMTILVLFTLFWPMAGFWVGSFQGPEDETRRRFATSGAVVPLVVFGIAAGVIHVAY